MRTLRNIGNFHVKIQSQDAKKAVQPLREIYTCQDDYTALNHMPQTCSIWDLPESVLISILHGIHIRDLLSFRLTNSYFCNIIDNNGSIWAHASFAGEWPNESTTRQFVKAAERKNLEAVVKLAVSYLYNEEQTVGDETLEVASKEAAHYLCQAERLTPKTLPFFWIFIRPPWSPEGSCCKLKTFQHIKDALEKIDLPDVTLGIALILRLKRQAFNEKFKQEEEEYFQKAVDQKSVAAAYFALMDTIALNELDKGKELEKVRLLRQLASDDFLEAKLHLIRFYTQGLFGGISKEKAQEYVREFFMSSEPSGIHVIYSDSHTSEISRYILIDWLVEVVGMKNFSAHVLYFAVSLFDRFLQVRTIERSQVQVLGVAAIVVSSRFLGFEILTIREAAWLTDNSYTYFEVVRMMGELVGTLRGNFRALTIQDYTKVLLSIVNEVGHAGVLTEYISMLCLLQAEMGQYSPAEIACSCLLLSRILLNNTDAWPTVLKEWTGFSQDYLSLCTFHIYNKCLLEGSEMEYRDTVLQAVKTRYSDPLRYSVSNTKMIGLKELCRQLGVTKLVTLGKDTKAIKFQNTDELIMSPHCSFRLEYHRSKDEAWMDRDHAATPPMYNAYVLDEGFSGYEGDLESESDDSCDKSEALFEDQDISAIADASDDGKHWYSCSEDNLADESIDDAESAIQDMFDSQADKTIETDMTSKIACLSSMCQSGANLACHSSVSFPSSCISNCSCKKSYSSTITSNSGLSMSSPSLLCQSSNSSSSLPSLNHGNIRTCLPCGSINSASKGSRRNRLNSCSNSCDILTHDKQECDDIPCVSYYNEPSTSSEYCCLRKAHSSDDIRTMANHAVDKNTEVSFDIGLQALHYDAIESVSLSESVSDAEKGITKHTRILDDVQLLDIDSSLVVNNFSWPSSHVSQGSSCNNSNSIDVQSQDISGCHRVDFERSLPSSYSQDHCANQNSLGLHFCEEHSSECLPTQSYGATNFCLIKSGLDNDHCDSTSSKVPFLDSTFDNHLSQQLHLKYGSRHDSVQMPATPESVLDMHKFSSRASSLVRSHDTFTSSSFRETNSTKFTTKKARLEYSSSLPASVDFALKQLDLSFESTECDKSDDCCMPDCISVNFVDDLSLNDFSCSANPKVTLKRKSCQH